MHPRPYARGGVKIYQAYPHLGFRVVRCKTGTHPPDGAETGETVVLDVAADAEVPALAGATWRGNSLRNGLFEGSGAPKLARVKWRLQTGDAVRASVVGAGGTLYVGSMNGTFYALDEATGTEKWHFETGGPIYSTATVAEGTVYFGSNDGTLYALDAATGEKRWSVRGDRPRKGTEREISRGQLDVACSPAIGYGLVVAGMRGRVRAFDAATGEEKWANLLAGQTQYLGSPTLYKGAVYYGHDHTRMGGWSLRTGERIFHSGEVGNDSQYATLAILDGRSYHVGDKAVAYCNDLATGKRVWMTLGGSSAGRDDSGALSGAFREYRAALCSPAAGQGMMVFGMHRGHVSGIELATGKERWLVRVGGAVRSSPAIAGGRVYFGCDDGLLYALRLTDGGESGRFKTGGPVVSSPWVGKGVVTVGSDDGFVYAVE
jgi:outer membrane protein assembly factor BamB